MDKNIKDLIISANTAYRSGSSIMTDLEFDDLLEKYASTVSEDEFNEFRNSLHEVSGKIHHPFILGSLNKLKCEEPDTIINFIKKYIKTKLNVSAKVDGISCRLHYSKGKLTSASTRGDGTYGEDLTNKIKYVKGIANKIDFTDDIDIRGELVIFKSDFDKMEGFSNPRNACAGIMNRKENSKEWNINDIENISFVPYTILGSCYTKAEQFEILERFGFKDVAWHKSFDLDYFSHNNLNIVDCLFKYATQDLPYEIDGCVISDDKYKNEEKYRPDEQAAVKTNQLTAETTLIDIAFEGPSKNGVFIPVAILEPVEIGGSLISRATCHNLDFIENMGLKYGCRVQVIKSGDIIPKIVNVISTPENAKQIELPEYCSCCSSKLIRDGVNLICKNENCSDQKTYQIESFIKKLGVMNASFKTLKSFGIDTYDKLLSFAPNKKYKSEIKFFDELKTKIFTKSPIDIFCALNMKDLGDILQRKIIDNYGWECIKMGPYAKCRPCDYFKKTLPEGIGQTTFNKFLDCYADNLVIVDKIIKDIRYSYIESKTNLNINKQTKGSICFTGSLSIPRTDAMKLAETAGYEVKNSVTKGLTYLVTSDPNSGSSKNEKAKKYGTKVIDEKTFMELVDINASSIMDL